jgi:CrcB protein
MARTHPLEQFESVVVIGIGGFAGSNLRYFVELYVPSSLAATMLVNIIGSLVLGFIIYEMLLSGRISEAGRILMAKGFLASFTTYSTFVVDALRTTPTVAIGYIIGSYALGFGAVLVGREAARRMTTETANPTEVSQ